ncbi:hypothetical protein Ccr5_gp298 [Caulobacter phage Ccr5]|nr:hypothetical protein Ccr5_gp298 [Caulobacter phage Ccr5]
MKVPLKQCPPGPFLYEGVLGFKTEYGAMSTRELPSPPLSGRHQREWYVTDHADAYCMSSGEAFWAGAKSREERDELLVQPLYEGWLKLNRPSDREQPSAAVLREAIDTALVQISGGLCYFTADAKHAQLRDAEKTLERALNGGETPFEKRVHGEEPAADWSLELHVFHAANNPDLPQATRELLKTLWKAYCEMEQRCEGAST